MKDLGVFDYTLQKCNREIKFSNCCKNSRSITVSKPQNNCYFLVVKYMQSPHYSPRTLAMSQHKLSRIQ